MKNIFLYFYNELKKITNFRVLTSQSFLLQKDAKYDPELEAQIRTWINAVLGGEVLKPEPDQKDFHESLKSGDILVEYVWKDPIHFSF